MECRFSKEDEEDKDEEKEGVDEEPLSESVAAAAIVVSLAPFFTIAAHLKLEGALLSSHLIKPCKLLEDR